MENNMNYTQIHNFIVKHFNEWEQGLKKALDEDSRKEKEPELFEVVSESITNVIGNVQNVLDSHEFNSDLSLNSISDFRTIVGDSEEFFLSRVLLHMSVGYVPFCKIATEGGFKVLFIKLT